MKNIITAFSLMLCLSLSTNLNAQFDVVWTDLVGVSVSGNTITKTATTGWGNGGAASVNVLLASQDGYVEMTVVSTTTKKMLGLSKFNSDANFASIDFALHGNGGGGLIIYESGASKGQHGTYSVGDILRVERSGTVITYKKNGSIIYTSSLSSSGSLIVDAALNQTNTAITNAKASFGIPWQNAGNDIYYDAGVVSVNTTATTKAFSVENTTSGNTEFQVNGDGKVYAREVEVTMNPFPDYVFEEEYPLMPLSQLKTFIKENGHLPNIPSAEVVDNNGIGLGDLSHKQMEKIEELTLYILQLDERLQKLEQKNEDVKNNSELNSTIVQPVNYLNQNLKDGTTSNKSKVSSNTSSVNTNTLEAFNPPPVTDWQNNGTDIFYDAGVVSVYTSSATKAFSIVENSTTQFQINGDGKAYAREVEVTLNAFPDYVFEKEYPLIPLTQLKKYIEKNKHLPNIPSAEVIDNKGIGLGDLSIKKMEKIEELTLYLLQLDERMEKLKK